MRKGHGNFNLLTDPWIPVLRLNGRHCRLGIKDTLDQAPEIRDIAAANPMDRFAVIRFLQALTFWCHESPPRTDTASRQEWFPAHSWKKLEKNKPYFNLFGEGPRFYQHKAEGARRASPNRLIHEIPTGTNVNHFRHAFDEKDGLCPACCALGLVRLPAFATVGGKGYSPGINGQPPVYVLPLGESLAETICLSWPQAAGHIGTPAWLDPCLGLPTDRPVPLLTGLTWLPWQVWLGDPEGQEAPCIACARVEHLVRAAEFKGRGEKPKNLNWRDPHAMVRDHKRWEDPHAIIRGEDLLRAPVRLKKSREAAAAWVAQLANILRRYKDGRARRWLVVAFAANKAKYHEIADAVFELAPQLNAEEMANKIQEWTQLRARKGPEAGVRRFLRSRAARTALAVAVATELEETFARTAMTRLAQGPDTMLRPDVDQRAILEALATSFANGETKSALEAQKKIRRIADALRQAPAGPLEEVAKT